MDVAREAPLLLDGAIGTQLLDSGFDPERDWLGHEGCCEVLDLTRPEQVRAVHESYLDAGSDLICTNTFGALRSVLERFGLASRRAEIVRAATRAAREAVEAWTTPERPRGVIGTIGPGLDLPSRGGRDREVLADEYGELAAALAEGGVDILLLETAADPIQIATAAQAVRSACGLPLWISLAPDRGQLVSEFAIADAVSAARDHAPELLAINCGRGPVAAAESLPALREAWAGPLGFWPSASADGSPGNPFDFAEAVAGAARTFDLRAVGGCCGTGPTHIRRLAAALGLPGPEDDWYEEIDEDREEDFDSEE